MQIVEANPNDHSTHRHNRRYAGDSGHQNNADNQLRRVHNGMVDLCGTTAEPEGDVKVQTKKVLESIDKLLQMAGTDKSKLLFAQVWLANMQDFEDHNSVWNDWVDRQNPPARACVGAPLWRPGILVEIKVTAAV